MTIRTSRWMWSAIPVALAAGSVALSLSGAGAVERGVSKESREAPKLVRWDIARCGSPACVALVAGGHARWRSPSGAMIRFTASGQAEVGEREASGGGLYVRRDASGHLVGRGVYKVTGFLGWQGARNPLGNVADAVGSRWEVRGGVIGLHVHLSGGGKGRLVISSFRLRTGPGHLLLHTATGRTITYLEKIHPGGQPLIHRIH